MDREKKIGILLIAIGICIPLMAVPFISGYSKDKGILDNLYKVGITIKKDKPGQEEEAPPPISLDKPKDEDFQYSKLVPKRIPFRFFLVITLIFFYMGIVRIDRSRHRPKSEAEENVRKDDSPPIEPE
jgi:hypothetical protein